MTEARHHAVAALAYLILLLAGVVVWLTIPVEVVEVVRWGSPAWWVLSSVMLAHHHRMYLTTRKDLT